MKQNGFTLVELLVGMAVAMLCMTMMLTVYAQISQLGSDAMRTAEYDAQLETGVLIAQKLIQNAGYGSGAATDIATGYVTFKSNVTQADATTSGKPAIFWRVKDPTSTCYGLAENVIQNGSTYEHRLYYLTNSTNSCDVATPILTTMTNWNAKPIVLLKVVSTASNPITNPADPIFIFNQPPPSSGCSPFGTSDVTGVAGGGMNGKLVTIMGKRLDISNHIVRSVCLRNIS